MVNATSEYKLWVKYIEVVVSNTVIKTTGSLPTFVYMYGIQFSEWLVGLIYLYSFLFVYLFIYLFIHSFVCLFVCVSHSFICHSCQSSSQWLSEDNKIWNSYFCLLVQWFCTSLLDRLAQILAKSCDRRHEAESVAEINTASLQEGGSSFWAWVYVQILRAPSSSLSLWPGEISLCSWG